MRAYAYYTSENGRVRYTTEKTTLDSYPVLPAENWVWTDNLDLECAIFNEVCVDVRTPGFNKWFIAGNEYSVMVAIFADSFEAAYEEFLDYLGTLPGYQGETPENEEDESLGQYDGSGHWFSECTLAYLWMHEVKEGQLSLAFNPEN